MLRSMMIGLDGSAYSEAAIELAIRWATRFQCPVTGIGIIDEPGIASSQSSVSPRQDGYDLLVDEARRHIGQLLDQFAFRCNQSGIEHRQHRDSGAPYEQIIAETQAFDLLLLGQHTYFRNQMAPGSDDSTLEQVTKAAPRPIIAVPEKLAEGDGILVAYDGRVRAARALQALLATGLYVGSKVWIMTVDKAAEPAEKIVGRAIEFLASHEIEAIPYPVVTDKPVDRAILDESQQLGAEIIVMGTFGESAFHEFFLGSVTSSLLEKSTLPLFLYH